MMKNILYKITSNNKNMLVQLKEFKRKDYHRIIEHLLNMVFDKYNIYKNTCSR